MQRSLRARATFGLGAITLTLVLVVGVAITALARLGGAIATILHENYRSVVAAEDMNEALERQDSATQFASTGHDDLARPLLATHRDGFARAFAVEAHNVTLPDEGDAVREIERSYREYSAAVDASLAMPLGAARAEYNFHTLLPRFTRVKDTVQRVLRMNQLAMEVADREAAAMSRRSTAITVSVGAIAVLIALWLAWRLPVTIVRPVRSLAEIARQIGEGNLEVTVEPAGVQELAPLALAFQRMVAQLQAFRASSLGELLKAQDLANATVQCLLDPVVVFGAGGDILLANAAAERTFGLRPGTEAELRDADIVVPEAFLRARDDLRSSGRTVATTSLSDAVRWRDRRGDRYFLVRSTAVRVGTGAGPTLVIAQDVTRLRRIDELKTDMVATVSHEFKTPLTSLRMATHLLLEPGMGPLTADQREIVTTARDETERLRALVDDLLDLVRIETEAGELHIAKIDPRSLLESAVEAHDAIARDKGVALEIATADATGVVPVDPEKLRIVLANLVSNAIRHTPRGGRVVLQVAREAGTLRIVVSDSGEGMPAEISTRLFDRGRGTREAISVKDNGRHGLGLIIAQEIVLQHGGEIAVQSSVGEGSAFTVVLPLERESDPAGGLLPRSSRPS